MDCTVFKTDKTFTRMQRPKLFFSGSHLCSTLLPRLEAALTHTNRTRSQRTCLFWGLQSCVGSFCTVQFRDCW